MAEGFQTCQNNDQKWVFLGYKSNFRCYLARPHRFSEVIIQIYEIIKSFGQLIKTQNSLEKNLSRFF